MLNGKADSDASESPARHASHHTGAFALPASEKRTTGRLASRPGATVGNHPAKLLSAMVNLERAVWTATCTGSESDGKKTCKNLLLRHDALPGRRWPDYCAARVRTVGVKLARTPTLGTTKVSW